jgi:hypothetical protein
MDGSGSINFNEFRVLLQNVEQKDLLKADQVLMEVKREWTRVHPRGDDELNFPQFRKVMGNCEFKLRDDELTSIFYELSNKISHTIFLKDFMNLLLLPDTDPVFINPEMKKAIFNIKRSRSMSIKDLFNAYEKMPYSFCNSFTADWFSQMKHLPFEGKKN